MGGCHSGDAESPGDGWDNLEAEGVRRKTNKQTGELEEIGDDDRPEDDCFEFEADEVVTGEQFLAVRPWKAAAAIEPTDHPEVDETVPDVTYTLEHVYGYRCQDSK